MATVFSWRFGLNPSHSPALPLCPNMFFLLLSNNMWRIFQLFIKQCQSFLGAGDAVNYSTITWVIMQRRREKSSSRGMKRTLAEVERLRWQWLGPGNGKRLRPWSDSARESAAIKDDVPPHLPKTYTHTHKQPQTQRRTFSFCPSTLTSWCLCVCGFSECSGLLFLFWTITIQCFSVFRSAVCLHSRDN